MGVVRMMHVPNRDPVPRIHNPIGLCGVKVETLAERDRVRIVGRKSKFRGRALNGVRRNI